MASLFEVGELRVKRGTKSRSYLRVGPYFSHKREYIRSWVLIPFTVIRGNTDGPILAHLAGAHPTEYAGIDATIKLSNTIKPEDLKGTFIGVHCISVPGFYERNYINPIDGKNVQGLYPGKSDGSISEMIAYRVFHDIVLKAHYFLDCHGGDVHESEIWSFIYYGTNDDVEKKSEAIARATGLKYSERSVYYGALGMEAAKHGIPGGLYELCTGDRLLPVESSAIFEATLNVMRYLGMLEGEAKEVKGQPCTTKGQEAEIWRNASSTYFTKAGLYHTNVKPGDILKEGEVIGTVTDLWGEVIETIRAPAAGRVGLMIHNPIAKPGETAITVHYQ